VQEIGALALEGDAPVAGPVFACGIHGNGGHVALSQRVADDVGDVVVMLQHHVGRQGRPFYAVRRCCDLQPAIFPPAELVAATRVGILGPIVDHAGAELDGRGVLKLARRALPVDAVIGLHVPDMRGDPVGTVTVRPVPDAEEPGLWIAQHGEEGLVVAVLAAGDDGIGDVWVPFEPIHTAGDLLRLLHKVIIDEQVGARPENQGLSRATRLPRRVDAGAVLLIPRGSGYHRPIRSHIGALIAHSNQLLAFHDGLRMRRVFIGVRQGG